MAFMLVETPENQGSVSRPVSRQIVREVADRLGIDRETPIRAPGYLGSLATPGSPIGQDDLGDLVGDDGLAGISIQLDEEYDEDSLFTTAFYQNEYPPIFHDPALGLIVRPVYSATVARLAFEVRFRSRTEAVRWRDHIRHKVSAGQRELKHTAEYAYLFPVDPMRLIRHVYDLREANAGYGDSWSEYATEHFTPRLKQLSNRSGTYKSPAISEVQEDIIGWWDFDLSPDVDTVSEAGEKWVLSFEYTYRYDKPTAVAVHYPIMVHQQLVERHWIPSIDAPKEPPRQYASKTRQALDLLRQTTEHLSMISGVQLPAWDDWLPSRLMPDTATVFTAMIMKDADDPTLLTNLNELGSYAFDPAFAHYLSEQYQHLSTRGNSPIAVELYKGQDPAPEAGVYVTPTLEVRSAEPLDDRSIYHLRVSLLTNLKLLSRIGRESLLAYPKACLQVLETLDPTLGKRGLLPQVLGGRYIPPRQFEIAADHINQGLIKHKAVLEPFVGTVGHFFVGVHYGHR